jgi:hypothetical protein
MHFRLAATSAPAFLLALLLIRPAPLLAQYGNEPWRVETYDAPRWAAHAGALGVNALVGGATAGTVRWLRGGSFGDAFFRGMAGGAGTYAGKVIAAGNREGAGLVGRQVAAVGSSVSRNAADGLGTFDLLSLPVGPLRVHLGPGERGHARVTVDLLSVGWIAYAALEPALRFDPGATLSAGAPVWAADEQRMFWGRERMEIRGFAPAGAIFVRRSVYDPPAALREIAAHERVHVIQHDHLHLTLIDPLERWALGRWNATRAALRYVEPGLNVWIASMAGVPIPYQHSPWEIEARFLAEGAR